MLFSWLLINYIPEIAINSLKNLIKAFPDIYGEYGFYDSLNIKKNIIGRKYLALDQAMILISINNYLNNNVVQNRFEKDKIFNNIKHLLINEKFFE